MKTESYDYHTFMTSNGRCWYCFSEKCHRCTGYAGPQWQGVELCTSACLCECQVNTAEEVAEVVSKLKALT